MEITDFEKFEKFKIVAQDVLPFLDEFERQRRNCTSNIQAYERVESQHANLVGYRRFNDYESFRTSRRRKKNRI